MRPIGTFWIGPRLPDFQRLCVASWVAQGHEVRFFSYEPVANLPPGIIERDAADVMDRALIVDDAPELRACTRANLFRLAMLQKGEGVWCDSDLLLLRPLPAFEDILIGEEKNGKLCNAVLWLPPDAPLLSEIITAFLARGMPPWTYGKPRWKRFWKTLLGQEFKMSDYPKHQWGRHPLEYYVKHAGVAAKVQPWARFYYPVIYDDYLYKANPFQHIVDDPAVAGLHVFHKPEALFRDADPESFMAWAKARYAAHT